MVIPKYQNMMLPLLKIASDRKEHSVKSAIDELMNKFDLSDVDRSARYQDGKKYIFKNNVYWAIYYLKNHELVKNTRKGCFKITEKGLQTLKLRPEYIDKKFLEKLN